MEVWQGDKAFKIPSNTSWHQGVTEPKGFSYKWDDAEKWLAKSQLSAHSVVPKDDNLRSIANTLCPSPMSSSFRNTRNVSGGVAGTSTACSRRCCMASSDSEINKSRAQCEYQSDSSWRFKQYQILQKLKASRDKETLANNSPGARIRRPDAYMESLSCAWIPPRLSHVQPMMQRQDKFAHYQDGASRMMQQLGVKTPSHGLGASLKDAGTEISPDLSTRDMATQMTPLPCSCTSQGTSPGKAVSPPRHNTPTRKNAMQENARLSKSCKKAHSLELQSCHLAKLALRSLPDVSQFQAAYESTTTATSSWSRFADEEMEESSSPMTSYSEWPQVDNDSRLIMSVDVLEANVAAWEEAERSKCNVKFKREEARIEAWEKLQLAKAEADLKKLEVKLEKLRSQATEKIISKLCAARRRAHEMRAAAEAQQEDHIIRVGDQLKSAHRNSHFPGSFGVCFTRVT